MARLEVGVAILIGGVARREINVLRRALGDPDLGRIEPHITLVPPLRLQAEALEPALALLRRAAATHSPFEVMLGPPATFLPISATVHLPVVDLSGALSAVRAMVFQPPLQRATHPFVGHVTLLATATGATVSAACEALSAYGATARADRISLLHKASGMRAWSTLADVDFDGVRRVGTGPFELELCSGTVIEPAVVTLLEQSGPAGGVDATAVAATTESGAPTGEPLPVVVTARRQGRVVGAAWGGMGDGPAAMVVEPAVRGEGIGTQLVREWRFRAQRRAAGEGLEGAEGAAG